MYVKGRRESSTTLYGGFLKLGIPFWGPHNKEYSRLGARTTIQAQEGESLYFINWE